MTIFAWIALGIAALTVTATLVLFYIDTIGEPDISDAPGTGTEAPISDSRVRELMLREEYESECG